MISDLNLLASKIGHHFNDPDLLALALTHPSCALPHGNNQRLEFLGDAVLDLIIAETIYRQYPNCDEGELDRLRAGIVNGKSLAAKARQFDIASFLRVSQAHHQHHPEPSHAMLEDALEALIGAIFLDGGLEAARQFTLRLFAQTIADADTSHFSKNPKSRLQELSQKQYLGATPEYSSISADGPDHDRKYTVSVALNGTELGRGSGSSKKAAESAAAQAALLQIEA